MTINTDGRPVIKRKLEVVGAFPEIDVTDNAHGGIGGVAEAGGAVVRCTRFDSGRIGICRTIDVKEVAQRTARVQTLTHCGFLVVGEAAGHRRFAAIIDVGNGEAHIRGAFVNGAD